MHGNYNHYLNQEMWRVITIVFMELFTFHNLNYHYD